jgi:hypothetical protein
MRVTTSGVAYSALTPATYQAVPPLATLRDQCGVYGLSVCSLNGVYPTMFVRPLPALCSRLCSA